MAEEIITLSREEYLDALRSAYHWGSEATKQVNFRSGITKTYVREERAALNRLLRGHGARPLTDAEYKQLFGD